MVLREDTHKAMIRAIGIIACVLIVACHEDPQSHSFRDELRQQAFKCANQYAVVNLDGTVRCAQLVPGIAWQPYMTVEDEEEARRKYLKQLAVKSARRTEAGTR